ncbi:LysR substrate-binding domain-containing protein [Roseitranquillus sediminis]|uniref:LysR substrate-binding domain-containing protein n=1 Tax=Roseitranquillus sediminis TaxID=2809051 RepID=UPI001D0CDD07|nr:LysR substrate-binding domain-containing protein [Roseitranquillus sediminis]MBM9593027.1 LysR family transcriptional regulator [Roseitranquillus sediminis]
MFEGRLGDEAMGLSGVSLPALRTFEAVARVRSMSGAAAELGVTQSAVSRSIQILEEALGTSLFRRSRPLLSLTEAGELLYGDVRLAFDRLDSGIGRVRALHASGRLIVDVLPTFAIRFLIPRLGTLRQASPNLEVDVTISESRVDFATGSIDVAIRYGLDHQWKNAVSARLMGEEMVLVCAPSLRRLYGEDLDPGSLAPAMLLRHTTRIEAWDEWFAAAGIEPVKPSGLGLEHYIMVIEAAVAGLGFALLPRFMIQRELSGGSLVVASMPILRRRQGYYLLHAEAQRGDERVVAFETWLRGEIHRSEIACATST